MAAEHLILEGIVTTLHADGRVNISPMGPIVDSGMTRLVLRPFQTSTTFLNLKRSRAGVFHITDDVELLARAAIGRLDPLPEYAPIESVDGVVLTNACRWFAFRVVEIDVQQDRAELACDIVDCGCIRDFVGFNRAKHAVVEAAILATRVELLPAAQIEDDLRRLAPLVEKTGGAQERRAFALLQQHVNEALRAAGTAADQA